jgi:phosphatidate phosphatase LPIN
MRIFNVLNTGCMDIIVVQQRDLSLKCSPFHVHFGPSRLPVPTNQNYLTLYVNDVLTDIKMRLDQEGDAYFEQTDWVMWTLTL